MAGMRNIPDHSIDMILCDLPYGTTRNAWDSVLPLDELWVQYKRVAKKGAAIVLTCQIPFTIDVANSNREWLRYEWIWEKATPTGFLNASRMPLKAHENVLVFYESLCKYNPQGLKCAKRGDSEVKKRDNPNNYGEFYDGVGSGMENFPRDVIRFKKETTQHPTQKPVALFEYLIRTYTDEGDVVLDNCIGSGTTAVACIQSGRHYIGYETDPEYYNIAVKRCETATQKASAKTLEDWF